MNRRNVQVVPGPSASPLPALNVEDPLTLTIFGATGDLTRRKLMPALYAMHCAGFLPDRYAIVGYARRDYTDETFRSWMEEAIREFSRLDVDEERLGEFSARLYYHRGDLSDADSFQRFKSVYGNAEKFPQNHLFYLSIKPELFGPVIGALKEAGLVADMHDRCWTRVVIEKPFGHDLASALALNRDVRHCLSEDQIYRIDHYLGKETVQNILSFRFANTIFEPVLNNRFVDHIQITASESVGMESGRGAYYDAAGAIRDMMQNHLFQLLCLVMMEPPSGMTADAIRNEKVKVLQSIKTPSPEELKASIVRAQYTSGTVEGAAVPGYLEEDRVDPASRTETFIAKRLHVNNWRWAGVPVYLRTGKRMEKRRTEVAIQFKTPPLQLFQTVQCDGDLCDLTRAQPNVIVFRIQPQEGISLLFSAKRPVLQVQVENVEMDFSYAETWKRSLPEAYERLLLDVMRGDSTLFTRSDEVEASWRIIDPVLQLWDRDKPFPMHTYPAGSWGPAESTGIFPDEQTEWRDGEEGWYFKI